MVGVLTRAPFKPLEVAESWDAQLLEKAAALIGYKPTAVMEMEVTRKRSLDENIFARALERAEIEPFTVKSVELYKAAMIQEAEKNESWALTRFMHRGQRHGIAEGEKVVYSLGIPAWITSGVASLVSLCLHYNGWSRGWGWDNMAHRSVEFIGYLPWQTAGYICALPFAALASWSFLMFLRHKRAIETSAYWDDTLVQNYKRPIPAFAVDRMLSLKAELPEVTFRVHELSVSSKELKTQKHIPPPPPDPFLVAEFRGVCAYVDVWNEPKFEGRRTV